VERTFTILEALCEREAGIVELSERVELNKTTVHRLLGTLVELGYVKQNEDTLQYGLSSKFLSFSESVVRQLDIISLAKPHLRALSQKTHETIHLVSLEGHQAVYIDKLESTESIRMYSYVGKHIPLYCTAVGKIFLAHSDQLDFDAYYETEKASILPLTEKTIVTPEGLKEEINLVRDQGYAVDDEENEPNTFCVSAPIYDHLGKVRYAISVSAPKFRVVDKDFEAYVAMVKETANLISREIGGGRSSL
jgi:DNA-binding IclR family transcriptional regulator